MPASPEHLTSTTQLVNGKLSDKFGKSSNKGRITLFFAHIRLENFIPKTFRVALEVMDVCLLGIVNQRVEVGLVASVAVMDGVQIMH